MKYILLNEYKKPLYEVEIIVKSTDLGEYVEVKSNVDIILYSSKLLSLDKTLQRRFIEDMSVLCEIEDWVNNHFLPKLRKKLKQENSPNYLDTEYEKKLICIKVGTKVMETYAKYGLNYKDDISKGE